MDRNEERFDKIENYLRGKMSLAEAAAFERVIAADPALEEEVAMQRFEQDALELLVEDKIRANLKSWKEMPPTPPPASNGNQRWWLWGVLVLLIGVGTYSVYFNINRGNKPPSKDDETEIPSDVPVATDEQPESPKEKTEEPKVEKPKTNEPSSNTRRRIELLAMATEAYSLPLDLQTGNLKGDNTQEVSPLDAGIEAFEAKNYRKTIQELKDLTPAIGEDYYDRSQELLGHSYYLNRQYRNAAQIFEKMANDQEYTSVRQYGEWYLTLSLLPYYDTEKDRVDDLLKSIITNEKHAYYKQANDLQQKLKQINQ